MVLQRPSTFHFFFFRKVLIFCDHYQPAVELTELLASELRWPDDVRCGPDSEVWRSAWKSVLPVGCSNETPSETKRRDNFISWLVSDGIRSQVVSWLGGQLQPELSVDKLIRLLKSKSKKARLKKQCENIAAHANELFENLIAPESHSTRAILRNGVLTGMPGTTLARVAAVCEPLESRLEGVFFPNQPDFMLAVFNSPFGPDVLVTTDRLSEGVDLHRFCRFLIHHELDPSPVRTVQRNGRLRRVNSWAARTNNPIEVSYPALAGTRDENAVRIMERRLAKFDLLLGGVRGEIDAEESDEQSALVAQVLELAGPRLRKLRLGLNHRRKSAK